MQCRCSQEGLGDCQSSTSLVDDSRTEASLLPDILAGACAAGAGAAAAGTRAADLFADAVPAASKL